MDNAALNLMIVNREFSYRGYGSEHLRLGVLGLSVWCFEMHRDSR